jgi:Spy/CpxP family protein refolding chaperone
MQRKLLLAALLAAMTALGATMFAQGHSMRHGRRGWMLQLMTKELNLTEAQQQQVRTILQTEKGKIQPIMQQLHQNEQAENAAVTGQFDEAKARDFAQKQAALMADMMVEKERTKSQIYALLTPEQRQKAQELMQQREQRRTERMQKHQQQQQQATPQNQ